MYQPGITRCRPGCRASASGSSRCLTFSVLFLLLFSLVLGSHHPSEGKVLVAREETWPLCGTVALDPKDPQWSCCGGFYPFYNLTHRCCQTFCPKVFFVIPKDCKKNETEDCEAYRQWALGQRKCPRKYRKKCARGTEGKTLETSQVLRA